MSIKERLNAIAEALETASKQARLLAEEVDQDAFMKAQVEAVEIQKAAGRYDYSRESFIERAELTHRLRVGTGQTTNQDACE